MQNEKSVEQIIGKRIQKIRRAKGYTQQQFAEMIGLSTNYLNLLKQVKLFILGFNNNVTIEITSVF